MPPADNIRGPCRPSPPVWVSAGGCALGHTCVSSSGVPGWALPPPVGADIAELPPGSQNTLRTCLPGWGPQVAPPPVSSPGPWSHGQPGEPSSLPMSPRDGVTLACGWASLILGGPPVGRWGGRVTAGVKVGLTPSRIHAPELEGADSFPAPCLWQQGRRCPVSALPGGPRPHFEKAQDWGESALPFSQFHPALSVQDPLHRSSPSGLAAPLTQVCTPAEAAARAVTQVAGLG